MATKSPMYKILDGPPVSDLSIAHYWHKQGIVKLPVKIATSSVPSFELQVSITESAGNGPDGWIIGGLVYNLTGHDRDFDDGDLSLKHAYEEHGPFFRAFYSTHDRKGFLGFHKRQLIPYHHPIFNDPVDQVRGIVQMLLGAEGIDTINPFIVSRLQLIDRLLMTEYELAGLAHDE